MIWNFVQDVSNQCSVIYYTLSLLLMDFMMKFICLYVLFKKIFKIETKQYRIINFLLETVGETNAMLKAWTTISSIVSLIIN